MLTFEDRNGTLILQNTDFYRVEITSLYSKCRILSRGLLYMEKIDPLFQKMRKFRPKNDPLYRNQLLENRNSER